MLATAKVFKHFMWTLAADKCWREMHAETKGRGAVGKSA